MRLLRIAVGALALCLLQSCGGGGGGDGGGNNNARFTITLDRTTIAFDAFEGEFPPGQLINATARGEYTGEQLFVGATVEGQGIDPTIQINILSDTNAQIAVRAASGLTVGTYTGRVIFHACSDQACATHVGGTPIPVNYTVTVRRGVHTTPSVLQLTSVSGTGTSGEVSVQFADGATTFGLGGLLPTELNWMSLANVDADSFTVEAKSMPVGNYAGQVTVGSGGSTTILRVEYSATEPPGGAHGIIAPQSLTLATSEGAQVSETMLVTPPTWNPGLQATVLPFFGGATDWLTVTPATGGFTVTANAGALVQGSYVANIQILTVPEHEGVTVQVNFTVGPGFVQPATTVIDVDSETTPAQLSGAIRIDIADGAPIDWTASTDTPWLTLTRAAGQSGTDVEFTIDPTTVDGWDNFTDHAATIHVAGASSTLTPIDCDVSVQLRIAEVTGVGPYLLIAGQSSKAIVRGRGLSGLANPLARLRIDNAAADSASLVNDTELAVDVGALALGTHTIRVTNALNRAMPTRELKVIAAQSYAYKAIALNVNRIDGPFVYDADRQNAYITQSSPETLIRLPVGSSSTVAETLPNAGGRRIGLTADNASFVTGGQTFFALLDRDTLETVPGSEFDTLDTPLVYSLAPAGDVGLMVSNDSRLWYPGYFWLQIDPKVAGTITLGPQVPSSVQAGPRVMSRNGERIIGVDNSEGGLGDLLRIVAVDAADSVLRHRTPDLVNTFPQMMVNDDGTRVLAGYAKVYDEQLATVGDIVLPPSASAYDPYMAAISPDGTRVYLLTYLRSDYNLPAPTVDPRVYVFDSSTPVSAPQTLPVLGYFEIDDYPGCLRSDCYSPTFANVTPDGGAVLFVGNRNFVVVPTDSGLTAAATVPGNHKTGGSTLRTVPWRR